MKILLLTVLLQIGLPQYQFKSTSNYVYGQSETINIESNINYNKSPRKVSGIDGWLLWITWGYYNNVPSSASNKDLFGYYDYIQNGGILSYNEWYEQKYNPLPVGNVMILMIFTVLYIMIKRRKEIILDSK